MLKMRLQRVGRKNDPSFRIVVLEGTEGPKSGNHVDQIGFYNAVTKEKGLDTDKAKHWISKGVQPSDTVYNMLVTAGVIDGKKKNVLPKKTPIVKEEPVVEAPAPAAAPVEEAPVAEAPADAEAVADKPVKEVAPVAEEVPVVEEVKAEEPTPEAEVVAEAPAEPAPEEAPAA